jgi:hypothetical protein
MTGNKSEDCTHLDGVLCHLWHEASRCTSRGDMGAKSRRLLRRA